MRFFDCRFYEYKIADAWSFLLSLRISFHIFFLPLVSNIFFFCVECVRWTGGCVFSCGFSVSVRFFYFFFFFVEWNVVKLIWLGSKASRRIRSTYLVYIPRLVHRGKSVILFTANYGCSLEIVCARDVRVSHLDLPSSIYHFEWNAIRWILSHSNDDKQ